VSIYLVLTRVQVLLSVYTFAHPVYMQAIRVKFVYDHRIKVKVTGAKNVQNAYSRNVNFNRRQLQFYKKWPSGLHAAWGF